MSPSLPSLLMFSLNTFSMKRTKDTDSSKIYTISYSFSCESTQENVFQIDIAVVVVHILLIEKFQVTLLNN